jgi:RNA polymerase sigma-70 factor (ECF subfamily)
MQPAPTNPPAHPTLDSPTLPVREDEDVLDHLARVARTGRSALVAVARAEGVSPEDAVDCLHEALCTGLGLARAGRLPPSSEEWSALLTGIVRNCARNARRRHFRAKPHDDADEVALAQHAPLVDDLVARAEEHVRLHACVEELCEIQRAVVTLRMLEEQAGEDVAQALGISPGYVAVLLHRAKAALRVCMTRA